MGVNIAFIMMSLTDVDSRNNITTIICDVPKYYTINEHFLALSLK